MLMPAHALPSHLLINLLSRGIIRRDPEAKKIPVTFAVEKPAVEIPIKQAEQPKTAGWKFTKWKIQKMQSTGMSEAEFHQWRYRRRVEQSAAKRNKFRPYA